MNPWLRQRGPLLDDLAGRILWGGAIAGVALVAALHVCLDAAGGRAVATFTATAVGVWVAGPLILARPCLRAMCRKSGLTEVCEPEDGAV